MALRKFPRPRSAADVEPLPPARLPSALWAGGPLQWVTMPEGPPREPHAGACQCEACGATRLEGLAIRFY